MHLWGTEAPTTSALPEAPLKRTSPDQSRSRWKVKSQR